jgi:hypothetical protein
VQPTPPPTVKSFSFDFEKRKKKRAQKTVGFILLGVYANEENWSPMSHRTFFHRRRARWRNRNFIRPVEEGGKGK